MEAKPWVKPLLEMTDSPSLELNVDGNTTSANCVISEALVTMWTKNGTLDMAWSQRAGSVQEKLKLDQELINTLTACGSFSMVLAILFITTPLPGLAFIMAGMSFSPRPSIFLPLPYFLVVSSR